MVKIKTVLFDVSGVIADVRHVVSWKAKVAMEDAELEKDGIGFTELLNAYATGGFSKLFQDKKVEVSKVRHFYRVWTSMQEYPHGDVKLYPETVQVFNDLFKKGLTIAIVTRLTWQNVANILNEVKRRGFEGVIDIIDTEDEHKIEGSIKVFYPKSDDERTNDRKFVKVLTNAIENTLPQRLYIDDSLDRSATLRKLDPLLLCVGSCRGLFNKEDFSRVIGPNQRKVFDYVISDLEELLRLPILEEAT